MITREVLLHNGFDFRVWEHSNFQNEGKYTKHIDANKFITIGYSKLYKWNYEIRNCESHILISADCQDVIYIDQLQNLIDLADIKLILKRPDSIPFSDFHRSVDFAAIFDFSDNDFCITMAAAAERYCDEFNGLLRKIDMSVSGCKVYTDDFEKICKVESVKEIMKCGFIADRIQRYNKVVLGEIPNSDDVIEKTKKDLEYIDWDGTRKRWSKVDGKYIVTNELDRLITGTHEEISTAILKYGKQHENPAATDNFPVWCNDEVVVLYMKDGFLTYIFR